MFEKIYLDVNANAAAIMGMLSFISMLTISLLYCKVQATLAFADTKIAEIPKKTEESMADLILGLVEQRSSKIKIRILSATTNNGANYYVGEVSTLSSNNRWVLRSRTAEAQTVAEARSELIRLVIEVLCDSMEVMNDVLRPANLPEASGGSKAGT